MIRPGENDKSLRCIGLFPLRTCDIIKCTRVFMGIKEDLQMILCDTHADTLFRRAIHPEETLDVTNPFFEFIR